MTHASVANIVIVGAGPAGLAAAEYLAQAGYGVQVLERMPSVGRKLLMAGRGGLNITHSEPHEALMRRYGVAQSWLRPALDAWTTQDIQHWMEGLGQAHFTGSSGRVFPSAMKASPLLRAWLARLRELGVVFHTRTAWKGWDAQGNLLVQREGQDEPYPMQADATLLALGGASWPRLGSAGGWVSVLAQQGVNIAPLQPANCGFETAWSDLFRERFAGVPLKPVALSFAGQRVQGEVMVTANGLEGGAIYALSAPIRAAIAEEGVAIVMVDLRPDMPEQEIARRLAATRPRESLSNKLRKALRLPPVAVALLREGGQDIPSSPQALAARLKAVPVVLSAPQPLARAISTAGGITSDSCTDGFMLRAVPGVFVAGEMLDWEAPTGGYLLHACFATGRAAAKGLQAWLQDTGAKRYPLQP